VALVAVVSLWHSERTMRPAMIIIGWRVDTA
jgi:hypothetical protein